MLEIQAILKSGLSGSSTTPERPLMLLLKRLPIELMAVSFAAAGSAESAVESQIFSIWLRDETSYVRHTSILLSLES